MHGHEGDHTADERTQLSAQQHAAPNTPARSTDPCLASRIGNRGFGELIRSRPNDSRERLAPDVDRGARLARTLRSQTPRTPESLLYLQRTVGNAAVVGMLQRAALPAEPAAVHDPVDAPACDPAADALVIDFMSRTYDSKLFHPTTGVPAGTFDAEYQPAKGVLTITVGIAFEFRNGNRADGMWIKSVGGAENAARYTDDQFTWTPQEKAEWQQNALARVIELWSGRYRFHIQRPCWERLPPVDVAISIVPLPDEAPAKGGASHVLRIMKYPTEPGRRDGPDGGRDMWLYEQGADGITQPDSRHYVRGMDADVKYGEVARANPNRIDFAFGSDKITSDGKDALEAFGAALALPYMPPFPITVTGHASSEGTEESNMILSESRARNVGHEIIDGGAKTQPRAIGVGEKGAAPSAQWRCVDITIGDLESDQSTVAHEFGHIFGLGDEYPEDWKGQGVGAPAAHSQLAEDLIPGQKGHPILTHHSDSIMSVGEVVRPHHYVTFLEVLGEMTQSKGEWDVRPAPMRGRGDFAAPPPDGPVAV